jgi:hypothetical protein
MAVHTLRLPVNYIGRATTTLEAVTLTGVGLLHTRVSRDAETGVQTLLADFDMRGVVGQGLPSLTRYVITSVESLVLPHQPTQTLEITFPMEPVGGLLQRTLRMGVVKLVMLVDMHTGAVQAIHNVAVVLL